MNSNSSNSQPIETGSMPNWLEALEKMTSNFYKAIMGLPKPLRLGGVVFIICGIVVSFAISKISTDSMNLALAILFLIWIPTMFFLVYAFTKQQSKQSQQLSNLTDERSTFFKKIEDKHQAILDVKAQLEKLSSQLEVIHQENPEKSTKILEIKDSMDELIQEIQTEDEGYNNFLKLMNQTENLREPESKSALLSILKNRVSQKRSNFD